MAVKIKVHGAAVRELERGREVEAELTRRGRRIQTRAGVGHSGEYFRGRNRGRYTVRTESDDAKLGEQNHKNLTNAIEAGRG